MNKILPNRQSVVKRNFCLSGHGVQWVGADTCLMGKPNRIREWREKRGLTLEQLAELSHISSSYLQRMEVGERNVSLKSLSRISDALGVGQRELVPDDGRRVPIVGYVGAGAEMILHSEGQGVDENVPAPEGATKKTVAAVIRGSSLGELFDQWLVYYDQIRTPPTPDMIGRLCVVGLSDGRILVKKLQRGQLEDTYTLLSNTEPPIYDADLDWAAEVKQMSPR